MYYLSLIVFIGFIGIIVVFFDALIEFLQKLKIKHSLKKGLNQEAKSILFQIPYYQKLSPQEKEKIEKSIIIFINSKDFIGKNIPVTIEMKVTIAFWACFIILHLNMGCYENVKTIYIYPHTLFLQDKRANEGIVQEQDLIISGQATQDSIVLVWDEVKKEAFSLSKENVIIHEFAHEIDYLDGVANGIPPLPKNKIKEWVKVVLREYDKLKAREIANRYIDKFKLLGSYAATNEAEFFAILSERFFLRPCSLKNRFPSLYKELQEFYNIDPCQVLK